MKKPLLATLAALGVAALVAPVTPAAALNTVDSGKLRQAVTVNGILEHERALYAIATKNDGNRASGTAGYEASVKYVTKKLKQAGFKVKTQTFEFPTYEELAPSSLSEVSPTAGAYESATVEYSGSGDVTGTLVVAGGRSSRRRPSRRAPPAASRATSRRRRAVRPWRSCSGGRATSPSRWRTRRPPATTPWSSSTRASPGATSSSPA